ncbi:MAG: cobalamin synthesis protein, partial [Hyphomicrobiales bacterium]|nr:cobalamin synthesis protein [Hyphomicrobiales bacterium]
RYELVGVVTTFDAASGPAQLLRHPEVASQLDCADVVVITRSDVAGPDGTSKARDVVHQRRPNITVLESGKDGVPAASLRETLRSECIPWQRADVLAAHTPDVSSAFVPLNEPVSWNALDSALQQVLCDGTVLRVKGLVHIIGCETPQIVQANDTITREDAPENAGVAPGLTIIAEGVPASAIAATLASRLTFRGLAVKS